MSRTASGFGQHRRRCCRVEDCEGERRGAFGCDKSIRLPSPISIVLVNLDCDIVLSYVISGCCFIEEMMDKLLQFVIQCGTELFCSVLVFSASISPFLAAYSATVSVEILSLQIYSSSNLYRV